MKILDLRWGGQRGRTAVGRLNVKFPLPIFVAVLDGRVDGASDRLDGPCPARRSGLHAGSKRNAF